MQTKKYLVFGWNEGYLWNNYKSFSYQTDDFEEAKRVGEWAMLTIRMPFYRVINQLEGGGVVAFAGCGGTDRVE